jgi:RHS repeat-associated protein
MFISAASNLTSQFTGKERDAETGLDFFLARYYSGAQGRFMTPDWSAKQEPVPYAKLDNPQTLNLYAYVKNNPLRYTDPDGHGLMDWILKHKSTAIMQVETHKEPDVPLNVPLGKPYKTVKEAQIDMIKSNNAYSVKSGHEVGSRIVEYPGKVLGATPIQLGSIVGVDLGPIPPGTINRGRWHCHGSDLPTYNEEIFSPQDKYSAEIEKVPTAVGTPKGKILQYDPSIEQRNDPSRQIGVAPTE